MNLDTALDFARSHRHGVLITLRANGLPQLSNILYTFGADGVIRISITADRAKYKNLVRQPWAALHVTQADFYAYAVIETDVELSAVAAAPDDDVVERARRQLPRSRRRARGLGRLPRRHGPRQARGRAPATDPRLRDAPIAAAS